MPWTDCRQVNRNVAMPGGTLAAISAMSGSGITPGPLGISDTRPIADAPCAIASRASSTLAMQQTLTRGRSALRVLVRAQEVKGDVRPVSDHPAVMRHHRHVEERTF